MNRSMVAVLATATLVAGCATAREDTARQRVVDTPLPWAPARTETAPGAVALLPDFSALVAEAARRSPRLRAAWQDVLAASAAIPSARRLPEPLLSLRGFVSAVETRVGPQRFGVGLQQAFPWPSKLSRAADVAASAVGVAERRFERAYHTLVRDLRRPWATLAARRAAAAVIAEQAQVVDRVAAVVEARVVAGGAHTASLTRLALRREVIAEAGRQLDDDAARLSAEIRALAALPAETALPVASLPDTLPPAVALETVEARLAQADPDVAVAAAAIDAADATLRRAAVSGLPDFAVDVGWTFVDDARMPGVSDSGKDIVAVGIGVRLPLWRGAYDAEEDAARARIRGAQARREVAADAAAGRVRGWASDLERERRRATLYETTLPETAMSALVATLEAYSVGQASLQDVLELEGQLLSFQLTALEARAQATRIAAELDYHLGRGEAPVTDEGTR